MTETPTSNQPAQRGDFDSLWIAGIAAAVGYGVWTASQARIVRAAEARALMISGEDGWSLTPLAYVSITVAVAGVLAAAMLAGWFSAARRAKTQRVGSIPRPPAIPAGLLTAAVGWSAALVLTPPNGLFRITGPLAGFLGLAVWWLVDTTGERWTARLVFTRAAHDVLGFGPDATLARVQAGRWTAEQPGAIRATIGPGWHGRGGDYSALSRAAAEAGWHGPYQWRYVAARGVVIGELA